MKRQIVFIGMIIFLLSAFKVSFSQNAIHYDGSNDYVQTTFPGVLGTANRTFEAWVKVDVGASASNLCVLDFGQNSVGSRNSFSVTGARGITFISGGTNANIGSTTGVVTEGQWTHVAFVLNNGTGFLYVNGTQVGTGNLSTVNTPTTGTDLRIGQRVAGGSIPFEGAIDEVRVWNVARTQSEIANNMNAEFCTVPTGLVAYYTCNQGTAGGSNSGLTNLHNAVLNANGTLNNFSLAGTASNWVTGAPLTAGLTVSKNSATVCDSMMSPSGNFTWTSSGNYYDTLTNANSCDSILRFNLTVHNSIYEVVNDTSCDPYTSPSGKYTYTTSGTYFDTTTTSQGCTHIHELNLTLYILDTSVSVSGLTLTSNENNAVYTWLDCDNDFLPISGQTSQSLNVTSNGNYAVMLENGQCSDTSACIEVNWVGVDEISGSDLRIFPNPSKGDIFIEGKNDGFLKIMDSQGQVVFQKRIKNSTKESIVLPRTLKDGIYFIHLLHDQNPVIKMLIIQRD